MSKWLRRAVIGLGITCSSFLPAFGDQPAIPRELIRADAPAIALKGVRVIDGTGAAPTEARTVVIENGKITAVGASPDIPAEAQVLDLTGFTVMPGLVMLHEHLNYFSGRAVWHSQPVSYPSLYLAAGVTTIRTAGSEAPEVDLNLKRRIDAGKAVGPKIHLTGPFFNGESGGFLGDTVIRNADEGRRAAAYWASRGFTSFKIYSAIDPAAARAIIDEAHRHGVSVTGHLRSLGCAEAADLGIDSIEHSFGSCFKDLGVDPGSPGFKADPADPRVEALIRHLVRAGVVLVVTPFTSETRSAEELEMMHPQTRETYLRAAVAPPPWWPDPASEREVRKLERAFVAAGGRIGIGADAADFGHIAGYTNQRALQLLVEAGWEPLEVIRLATSNGAEILGVGTTVGRVAAGMAADLIVVEGDPAKDIQALKRIEIVFKDGVGYDSAKLRASVKGLVGWH